jgi:sortase A
MHKSNSTKKKRKFRLKGWMIAVIFAVGLGILFYPAFANMWNNHRQKILTNDYDQEVSDLEENGDIDYAAEWEKAEAYNESLMPITLPDSFAEAENREEEDSVYMSCLNLTGNGMMGTVEIPSIDITLPIMHTTDNEVLQNAAGHLEGSSLPIGGESTHCVIAAHRGLPSAALFTDLDKVKIGDHFYLHILDETLADDVDSIDVVEPEDTSKLNVVEGEDLCTLLTCTPYGVNTERLLVRGHRVSYDEQQKEDEQVSSITGVSSHTNYLGWALGGLGITLLFIYYLHRREKKKAG